MKQFITIVSVFLVCIATYAQEAPTKGFLLPRLTTAERNAMVNPAKGVTIFNTDTNTQEIQSGTASSPNWSSPTSFYNISPTGIDDTANITALLNMANGTDLFYINMKPGNYFISSSITNFKSNVIINGNGSVIKSNFDGIMFDVLSVNTVTIKDLAFHSKYHQNSYAQNRISSDTGIRCYETNTILIDNCRFSGFLDTGIDMYYVSGANWRGQRNRITKCLFNECWGGATIWYRCEYGILSDCIFTKCRYAMLVNSGNWVVANNIAVDCRAAFVCQNLPGDKDYTLGGNFAHGSIIGCTFNHCDATVWNSPIKTMKVGTNQVDILGVYIKGVIAPQITGSSFWYTNIYFEENSVPYGLYITGCTITDNTVTAETGSTINLYGTRRYNSSNVGNVIIN